MSGDNENKNSDHVLKPYWVLCSIVDIVIEVAVGLDVLNLRKSRRSYLLS